MRNSKVKGFTLVELIVVIAIIGILAAILVPSMLGYVRNAKVSSANAGAKQVHTAAASAITQLGISNYKWGGTAGNEAYFTLTPESNTGTVLSPTWTNATGPNDSDLDLVAYLGESFKDYGRAFFNKGTYSVDCATYASTPSGWSVASTYTTVEAVKAVTEGKQKDDAKAGNIYGIYPAPQMSSN